MKKIALWLAVTVLCINLGCKKKEPPAVFTDVVWNCKHMSTGQCNPTALLFKANGEYEEQVTPTLMATVGSWDWVEPNKSFHITKQYPHQYTVTKLTATELYIEEGTNSFQYSR